MMNKTKYLESFCEECVNYWIALQDSKSINEIQDKEGAPNFEQGGLF